MSKEILDCPLVQEAARRGIGDPEIENGKCYGYGYYTPDGSEVDEPHFRCQECELLFWNEEDLS